MILRFLLLYILLSFPYAAFSADSLKLVDSLRLLVIDHPDKVEKSIDVDIAAAKSSGDSFLYARLLDTRGLSHRNLGKYADAINDHKASYDIYNRMKNRRGMAGALNSIAIIMIRTDKYDDAVKYLNNALQFIEPTDSAMLNSIYINLGVCYDYTNKQELAIETYKKALPLVMAKQDDYGIGVVLHNIAVCYSVLKKFKEYEEYEHQAMKYQEISGNQDLLARILISTGSVYLQQQKMDKALDFFEKGGKVASAIESIELKEMYLDNLVELYIRKQDPDKAMEYVDKLNKLREEVYNEENSQAIAEAETKFNVALKDKEIENLKISKNLAVLQSERNALLRNVMAVIIILILIVFIALIRNYQLRKRNLALLVREKELIQKEKLILEDNNELLQNENMLARFEILKSQVSPHFLFNTLNALSYLIESDSDKAMQFTTAFSKLYRTILELKDKNLISLEEELQHVESYFFLQRTRFGSSLNITSNISTDVRSLNLPPFSIQICVENAINHNVVSEKYPLSIHVYNKDNILIIENNLREKSKIVKSTSIGIANIKSRYSFFTSAEPEFKKEGDLFVVKLPLLRN